MPFIKLTELANITSPFADGTLKTVSEYVYKWLKNLIRKPFAPERFLLHLMYIGWYLKMLLFPILEIIGIIKIFHLATS